MDSRAAANRFRSGTWSVDRWIRDASRPVDCFCLSKKSRSFRGTLIDLCTRKAPCQPSSWVSCAPA